MTVLGKVEKRDIGHLVSLFLSNSILVHTYRGKNVNRYLGLFCISWVLIVGLAISGCSEEQVTKAQEVTFSKLFASPDKYNGKRIMIEGFYFHGFEVIVLSEELEYSGLAPGHLVPKGKMVWIEGGIPEEIHDKLYQQQMAGPEERYGKVKVTGEFEYGAKYGHLGAYNYQIVASEVQLTPWSLPTTQAEPLKGEGFAIYLLAQDIPVSDMPSISHIELPDEPLLSLGDIVSYSGTTHEIELSTQAIERLLKLEVPTNGRVFVVCIDRQPVYWGAFWVPYSSMSFDGVTILKPLSLDRQTIQLELGYPSSDFFTVDDPRPDPDIMNSLQQSGKLR